MIDCWAQRSQDTLNQAIDQLPKRLTIPVEAKGGHVEFCPCDGTVNRSIFQGEAVQVDVGHICTVKRHPPIHAILHEEDCELFVRIRIRKLMHHCHIQCNFGGIDNLCKIGKEYLTPLACKLCIAF